MCPCDIGRRAGAVYAMTETVNIRRDVKDDFYRYKMPKMQTKIEGKGNGIKTVIANMEDVGKALNRSPSYVTKFFGSELGAQTICDEKSSKYVVNGVHEYEALASVLDSFISKFVLCPGCENPETKLSVSNGFVDRSCKACGKKSPVDMNHKLVSFIVKNPPKKNKSKMVVSDEADKRQQAESTEESSLHVSFEELSVTPEDKAPEKEKYDANELFAKFLEENPNATDEEIIERSKAHSIGIHNAASIYLQLKFANDLESIPKSKTLLKFASFGEKTQLAILGSIERLVSGNPSLQKKLPALFLALYNEDLIEEDSFLEWNERISKRFVEKAEGKLHRSICKEFIQWLEEAESEESE